MADELASTVVRSLAQYLIRKSEAGSAVYDAQLENVLGLLVTKLSSPFHGELLARFTDSPAVAAEQEALRVHLDQEIRNDPEFGAQLRTAMSGAIESRRKLPAQRRLLPVLAVTGGVAVVIAGTFIVARSTAQDGEAAAPGTPGTVTVTAMVPSPPANSPTATSSTTTSTVTPSLPSASDPPPDNPGDGSSVSKGTPVFVADLPKPSDQWYFEHGDHDVRLTPYQKSVWTPLSTCNDDRYSGVQQFNLKNFSSIEVQAVGMDGNSDPSLAVKFEIFVNNDRVKPVAAVAVSPGDAKPLRAELPAGTFALTLRSSLVTIDKSKCKSGNAVWGAAFVVAAGR
ncbi:hypothetical protein JOF56_007606 [Kibdelosporangium banguiense]|uniref:Glycosyl hydrolase family 98 putative carbohydrate-binding module domain-containing protein n=1 Tax=Kibdelosporangium banguiense TaxID=1365924 RepID=A0ABS4TTG8_9PSEU|nr:hypothetical protein [Kibdelosporangium banguiense]MBP2327221.1 hypothetical protein [Kibdelosporangium banguiense]